MSTNREPNPPSRKDEDFPKTNTMPEGWRMEGLVDASSTRAAAFHSGEQSQSYVPATGGTNGRTHEAAFDASAGDEHLFSRRLDPFPTPGDQHGMYL